MKCGFHRNKSGHCFNDDGECIVCHTKKTGSEEIGLELHNKLVLPAYQTIIPRNDDIIR